MGNRRKAASAAAGAATWTGHGKGRPWVQADTALSSQNARIITATARPRY